MNLVDSETHFQNVFDRFRRQRNVRGTADSCCFVCMFCHFGEVSVINAQAREFVWQLQESEEVFQLLNAPFCLFIFRKRAIDTLNVSSKS